MLAIEDAKQIDIHRTIRLIQSWKKNRTPQTSARWTKNLTEGRTKTYIAKSNYLAPTDFIDFVVHLAAIILLSELFALTWDDLLFT